MMRLSCHDGQSAIDLSSSLLTLANNIISRVVLGQKCTDVGNGDGTMGQLVKQANELITSFSFGEYIPFLSWLDNLTGFNRKGIQTSQALHAFMDRVIDEHENQPACHSEDGQYDRRDFVHIINGLQNSHTSGQNFTRGNIKAILLVNFYPGHQTFNCFGTIMALFILHTMFCVVFQFSGYVYSRNRYIRSNYGMDNGRTAATMEWTMAELMKRPSIMKRVQDEIRDIVGEQLKISEHDINRMEYLHRVVKESLRLHSPFIISRQASTDVTIGGFKLPTNSSAVINSWAIHRDPHTWDNPLEFLPDRFLNRNSDYKGQDHNYKDHNYIPFGVGRRSCPGAHYAVTEVEYALANLLFWFNWELPDGMSPEDLDMSETVAQVSHKKLPLLLVPVPKTG